MTLDIDAFNASQSAAEPQSGCSMTLWRSRQMRKMWFINVWIRKDLESTLWRSKGLVWECSMVLIAFIVTCRSDWLTSSNINSNARRNCWIRGRYWLQLIGWKLLTSTKQRKRSQRRELIEHQLNIWKNRVWLAKREEERLILSLTLVKLSNVWSISRVRTKCWYHWSKTLILSWIKLVRRVKP